MPQAKTSGEERKTTQMPPRINGSYKPVNTLSRNNQPLIIQRSVFLKPAPFDLHATHSEREHPKKRRKISDDSLSSNVSSKSVIDVEESETINSQKSSHAGANRSVRSQGLNSSFRNGGQFGWEGVEEFRRVEKQMNPRSRRVRRGRPGRLSHTKSTSSDGQQLNGDDIDPILNRSVDSSQLGHTITRVGDNVDDPVYYSDVEGDMPQNRKVNKTIPEVVIYRPTGQGPAIRASAEPQVARRTSSYFTSANIQEDKSNLIDSQAHHSMESLRKTRLQPTTSHKTEPSPKRNGPQHADISEDELALVDEAPRNIMQQFAKNKSPSVSTRGNIKGTKFGPSSKTKEGSSVERYPVSSIFSKAHYWLRPESGEVWLLHQDTSSGTLVPYDGQGVLVREIVLKPQVIQKIQGSPHSEKLVIHKHKESKVKGSTMIFLELCAINDARLLCNILKEHDSTIGLMVLEKTQLDRIFLHNRKLLDSMAQKPALSRDMLEARAEDIQLFEQKDADRRDRENSTKQEARNSFNGCKTSDRSDEGDSVTPLKRKTLGDDFAPLPKRMTLGGSMKTRSSNTFEIDDAPSSFKTPHIGSGSFYGDRTRSSSRLADRELSSKLPHTRSPSPEQWSILNPNWAQDWRGSVIYPRGSKKKSKTTVDKQDIERLDEGAFLNDNLINFYLCWLEQHLEQEKPELAEHIYFHNTFFYKSLTQAVRGKRGINYEAVERWTSKVDLLSFDYIIVPINENTHWYVAIICNAPQLLGPEPKVIESSQSQENDGRSENLRGEAEVVEKSPAPPSSAPNTAKWEPNEPKESEVGVDVAMEGMSLEDKEEIAEGRDSDDEWPNDHLEPRQKTLSPIMHDSSRTRKAFEATVGVEADLQNSQTARPSLAKKGKRKSNAPATRKYDITQPRIITLDSLGLKHYSTCTNLKEYLIAEIKSKKNIDIPPPGSLGMAAVNIPQQTNYSDCGLFLLSYIEEFLKRPDDFIHKIMRGQELDLEFQEASYMRNHIREILFTLHNDQFSDIEKSKEEKRKKKQFSKAESKPEPSPGVKLTSREASESVRISVSPDQSSPANQDLLAELHQVRNAAKQSMGSLPAKSRRSSSKADPKNVVNVDDDGQDTSSTQHYRGNSLGSLNTDPMHTCRSRAQDESLANASRGRLNINAVEEDPRSYSPPASSKEKRKSRSNNTSIEATTVRRKRARSLSSKGEWNGLSDPSLQEGVDQNGAMADDPVIVTDSQPKQKEVIDMTDDDYSADEDTLLSNGDSEDAPFSHFNSSTPLSSTPEQKQVPSGSSSAKSQGVARKNLSNPEVFRDQHSRRSSAVVIDP